MKRVSNRHLSKRSDSQTVPIYRFKVLFLNGKWNVKKIKCEIVDKCTLGVLERYNTNEKKCMANITERIYSLPILDKTIPERYLV